MDTMSADGDDDDDDDDLSMSSDVDMCDPWKNDQERKDVDHPSTQARFLGFDAGVDFRDRDEVRAMISPEGRNHSESPDFDDTSGGEEEEEEEEDGFSGTDDGDEEVKDDRGKESKIKLSSMGLTSLANVTTQLSEETLDIESACATPLTPDKRKDSVNKRKSARPQWLFEGTALDKNSSVVENGCKEFELHLKQVTAGAMTDNHVVRKSDNGERDVVVKKNRHSAKNVPACRNKDKSCHHVQVSYSSEERVAPLAKSENGCNYQSNECSDDNSDLVMKHVSNHRPAEGINWAKNTATLQQSAID